MIAGIADGQEASAALQWLVHYCSPEIDRLAANADGVHDFFTNGSMTEKGTVSNVTAQGTAQGPAQGQNSNTAQLQEVDPTADSNTDLAMVDVSDLDDMLDFTMDDYLPGMEGVETIFTPAVSSTHAENDVSLPSLLAPPRTVEEAPPSPPPASPRAPLPSPPTSPKQFGTPLATSIGSPLSPLTSSDDSDETSESEVESELSTLPVTQTGKSSGRVVRPPPVFTSGVTLTHAPSKKRKLAHEAKPFLTLPEVATKREDLFWTSAMTYVTAAVRFLRIISIPFVIEPSCQASDVVRIAGPSGSPKVPGKKKKGRKPARPAAVRIFLTAHYPAHSWSRSEICHKCQTSPV